jgi:hypothetical protein
MIKRQKIITKGNKLGETQQGQLVQRRQCVLVSSEIRIQEGYLSHEVPHKQKGESELSISALGGSQNVKVIYFAVVYPEAHQANVVDGFILFSIQPLLILKKLNEYIVFYYVSEIILGGWDIPVNKK